MEKKSILDLVLVLVLLTNLRLLASSRLGACTRTTALQGVLLGLVPVLGAGAHVPLRALCLAAGVMLIKGVLFPALVFRAIREAGVSREVEPYVGYTSSVICGVAALVISFWVCGRLPEPVAASSKLLAPVALFGILCGLFLIVARKRAVNQVLGFIVLENGIFAFGAGLMRELPLLVEVGVLLDVFVAVFLMGIMVFHISREFEHIDTDQLSNLRD